MTVPDQPAPAPSRPQRRWSWWSILLIGSLALNCLLAGAIAARWYTEERIERFTGASYTQLLPRRFMADLPAERRKQLFALLGAHRKDFRDGRGRLRAASLVIADALEREPFDPELLNRALDGFAGEAAGLIGRGSDVAREIIASLTPEERKMLGKRIRERAAGRRHGPPGGD
jgi:uncharacterized membrane protein